MDIKIAYNPYFLSATFFKSEGDSWKPYPSERAEWTNKFQGRPLQKWFQKGINNAGFCAELAKVFNESEITIHFQGREIDCQDLEMECQEYNTSNGVKTRFQVVRPAQFIFSDEVVTTKLDELNAAMATADFANSAQIKKALAAYEVCRSREFTMTVVANMSSGKSTLINALLGQLLLPYGNKATTAKVTEIVDRDGMDHFEYIAYDENGTPIHSAPQEATFSVLDEVNKDAKIARVELFGRIPSISSARMRLRLKDTPGPNNSCDVAHERITMREFSNIQKPIIIFIMDVSRLDTTDDKTLLEEIGKAMKEDKQAKERMLFLINRCDELEYSERGKKEDIRDIVKGVRATLKELYEIDGAQIIPVSAKTALYQGYLTTGVIEDDEVHELERYRTRLSHFARDLVSTADLSATCRKALNEALEQAHAQNDIATETLIRSGIFGLQLTISEYLEKYAIPHKTGKYLEELERQLNDLKNQLDFGHRIAQSEEAIQETEAQKDALEIENGKLMEDIDSFRAEIETMTLDETKIEPILHEAIAPITSCIQAGLKKLGNDEDIPVEAANSFLEELGDVARTSAPVCRRELLKALGDLEKKDMEVVYQNIRNIVGTYKESLRKLPGYDVEAIADIIELSIDLDEQAIFSIQDAVDGINMSEITHSKRVQQGYRENPARMGFWGFFKIWEERWIPNYENEDFVKKEKLAQVLTLRIGKLLKSSKKPALEGMLNLYAAKKRHATEILERLIVIMNGQTQQIELLISQIKDNQCAVQVIIRQQDLLEEIQSQIKELR